MNMKKVIVTSFAAFSLVFSGAAIFAAQPVAADVKDQICGGANLTLSAGKCAKEVCIEENKDGVCTKKGDESENSLNKLLTSIVNIISVIVGVVAVIMVIFSGFKYITSGGDSSKISSAKTTIIYAIVGLIIVALAQVIVRFVLNKTVSS